MNKAARKFAGWLLLSLPFTVALLFSSRFSPPFSAPKNAILVLTASLLAALALVSFSGWKAGREARPFWMAVAAYVALNAFSAVISQNPSLCIGSLVLLVCGVLLFAGSLAALEGTTRAANLHNLQIAITVAAALVSLATVLQFFGMNPFYGHRIQEDSAYRMRMYATLGNPDFVATFLAAALPASIVSCVTARRSRPAWILTSALIGVAIVVTGSRGGLIAAIVGAVAVAFTLRRTRAWILLAVVFACALGVGTHLNSRKPWESLRGRIFIWQVSPSDGAARSVLGSGPGTFAHDYPARLGQFFSKPGSEPLLRFARHERHAQNDFVEALSDTGWLGLCGLVALVGSWFALATRKLRACGDEEKPGVAAAIACVSSLCAASLFDFPMHRAETWALFWISMAVPLVPSTCAAVPQPRRALLRYAGAALLLIAGSCFAFAPLVASYELAKGESEENQGRLQSSLQAYRSALRWEPTSPDANFDLVRTAAKGGDFAGALAQSRLAKQYVNEPELYILRSRILQLAGQESEARHEVEVAVK